jgi:hypothetical protein
MTYVFIVFYAPLFCFWLTFAVCKLPDAEFPPQFSATIEITSHLIPDDSSYPPSKRRMSILYDFINKRARIDIEQGYEAAKYYIRRYDEKKEYMVRLPPIQDCKRSHLAETMPFPDLSESIFVKEEIVNGIACNYFLFVEYDIRIHMYLAVDDNAPVRLIQENVQSDGTSIQLLTYEYSDVEIGEPDVSWFELPPEFQVEECLFHVGGFPYIHIFHYFVKI